MHSKLYLSGIEILSTVSCSSSKSTPNCTLVELKSRYSNIKLEEVQDSKLYLSGIEIFKQNLVSLIRLHSKLYLSGIEINGLSPVGLS